MRAIYFRTLRWSPVLLRGALWISISMGTALLDDLKELKDPAKFAEMNIVGWICLVLSTIMAGLITWRTFIDQTVARHSNKLEYEKQMSTNRPVNA